MVGELAFEVSGVLHCLNCLLLWLCGFSLETYLVLSGHLRLIFIIIHNNCLFNPLIYLIPFKSLYRFFSLFPHLLLLLSLPTFAIFLRVHLRAHLRAHLRVILRVLLRVLL